MGGGGASAFAAMAWAANSSASRVYCSLTSATASGDAMVTLYTNVLLRNLLNLLSKKSTMCLEKNKVRG